MRERVLVTGATGLVGTHLVPALIEHGCEVVTHSTRDGDIARCLLPFKDIDCVIHLAGKTFVPASWESPQSFYDTNVLGAINVLEWCRREGARLIHVSSYVYGQPQSLPLSEKHPIRAFNPYAHSKILAEEAVGFYASHFGVRAVIVRPFNIYGPGQAGTFLIPTLIGQVIDPACSEIEVKDLRPRRDFVYVQDVVSLLIAAVRAPAGSIYNVGSGQSVSIGELIDTIQRIAGRAKSVVSLAESRPDEVLDVVADISKAARELNWRPRVPLAEGIRQTVEWLVGRMVAQR